MSHFFKISSKWSSHDLGGGHTLYIAPVDEVMKLLQEEVIVNWEFNRPYDDTRVEEINERMEETGYVPGTIKLAQIGDSKTLVVYDGVHRLLALTPSATTVLLDIMFNVSEQKIVDEFVTVNKSVPVPELYITQGVGEDVKIAIEDFVTGICRNHKTLMSTSKNCRKPHFNSDIFTNDIYELYVAMGSNNIERVLDTIIKLNELYERDYDHTIPKAILEKCKKSGLYLFCEGRLINRDKFRLALYTFD